MTDEPAAKIPDPAPPSKAAPGTPSAPEIARLARDWPIERRLRWSTAAAALEQQGMAADDASRLAFARISSETRL